MSGYVISRKDHTSIFCPRTKVSKHIIKRKKKFAEASVAVSMIVLGLAIMILAS